MATGLGLLGLAILSAGLTGFVLAWPGYVEKRLRPSGNDSPGGGVADSRWRA